MEKYRLNQVRFCVEQVKSSVTLSGDGVAFHRNVVALLGGGLYGLSKVRRWSYKVPCGLCVVRKGVVQAVSSLER